MTKRIALVGCSFTDYYQDKNLNDPVKTWSEWMLDDNPDVQIDNYAASAHNLSYIEFVLRYIIKYKSDCYHSVMFNLPPWPRTWAPIRQSDKINFGNVKSWFTAEIISDNYQVIRCNISSFLISKEACAYGLRKTPHRFLQSLTNMIGDHRDSQIIPNLITLDIIDQYYAQKIPNLIYWAHEYALGDSKTEEEYIQPHYSNYKGNLSDTNKGVLEFLVDKYGEQHVAEHFLTDSAHLSSLGNKTMYEEFLLPNKNVQAVLKD